MFSMVLNFTFHFVSGESLRIVELLVRTIYERR